VCIPSKTAIKVGVEEKSEGRKGSKIPGKEGCE
jgi:hypothetical protein